MKSDIVVDVHTHMFSAEWMAMLREHGHPLYDVRPVANGRECIRGDAPVTVPTAGPFDYALRIFNL